jgi:hypothetical protein
VAVLALVFYANLGAVVGPEENLEDLHIALINKDRGGDLAGKEVKRPTRATANRPTSSPSWSTSPA